MFGQDRTEREAEIRRLMTAPVTTAPPAATPEPGSGYRKARQLTRSQDQKDRDRALQWEHDHPSEAALGCALDREAMWLKRLEGQPPVVTGTPVRNPGETERLLRKGLAWNPDVKAEKDDPRLSRLEELRPLNLPAEKSILRGRAVRPSP